jgi:hypothetical protein
METSPYSPSELEKCASHDRTSPNDPAVVIILGGVKTRPGKEVDLKEIPGALDGPDRHQYILEDIEHSSSGLNDGNTGAQQPALSLVRNVAKHLKRTEVSAAPIIYVAVGPSGREKILRLLQSSQRPSVTKDDFVSANLNKTLGVIFLPTPYPQRTEHTWLLITGQFMCCAIIVNYERCHGIAPNPCRAPFAPNRQIFPSVLTPILDLITRPSTFLFVLIALTWGVLATLQHHLNRTDRFQRYYLFTGILFGGFLALPSLASPEEGLYIASPLSIWISFALMVSATGHCFWRTFISPTKKRLNRTIDRWAREGPGGNSQEHVIRFHEID